MRPISLAVDVTNYVMLDLGQPLHAYDLATLAGPIVVRRAGAGERLTTLDDVDRALRPRGPAHHRLARTGRGARVLGLAGVMGGGEQRGRRRRRPTCSSRPRTSTRSRSRAPRAGTSCPPRRPAVRARRRHRRCRRSRSQRAVELLVEHGGGVAGAAVTDVDQRVPRAPRSTCRSDLPAAARRRATTRPTRCVATLVADRLRRSSDARRRDGRRACTPPSWRPDLAGRRRPGRGGRPAARVRRASRRCCRPPRRAWADRTASASRRSVARALAEHGPGRGAHLPVRRRRPARRARAARRRRPPARGAPGQPAVRRAAAAAHRTCSSRCSTPLRRNVGRGHGDLALFEIGLVTRPDAEPACGAPAAGWRPAGRRASSPRSRPPCRRSRAGSPGVLAGQREPAGLVGAGGRRADWTDAVAAARLVARRVGAGARPSRPTPPRAVAPRPLRPAATADGHPRRARRRAAPEGRRRARAAGADRRRSRSTSTC